MGLSAPYNSWFTLFGQFFDHGLDLTTKGGGTVVVPLKADDPLFVGGDGEAGTADDPANPRRRSALHGADRARNAPDGVHEHTNTTTSFVDQNQTYTSHPSHQVFLREYELRDGRPFATGKLLEGRATRGGGLATWSHIKAQAREMLGIELDDHDVLDVPLLLTDEYGRFIPGPAGFPQLVTGTGSGRRRRRRPRAGPRSTRRTPCGRATRSSTTSPTTRTRSAPTRASGSRPTRTTWPAARPPRPPTTTSCSAALHHR